MVRRGLKTDQRPSTTLRAFGFYLLARQSPFLLAGATAHGGRHPSSGQQLKESTATDESAWAHPCVDLLANRHDTRAPSRRRLIGSRR